MFYILISRWTGYNYGFDLIMTYNHQKHTIQITRNCLKQEVSTSVSMKDSRSVVWYDITSPSQRTCLHAIFIFKHIYNYARGHYREPIDVFISGIYFLFLVR